MRNKVVKPITSLLSGFVFVCINALVYCSGGNRWLISKKLKIGAVLISLTGIVACGGSERPATKCYKPPNDTHSNDSITKLKRSDSVKVVEKQKPVTKPTQTLMKTCYDYAEPPLRDSLNK